MSTDFLKNSPVLRVVLIWLLWGILSLALIDLLSKSYFEQLMDWLMSIPYLAPGDYLPQLFYAMLFFIIVTAFIRLLSYFKIFLYSTSAFFVMVFYSFAAISPDSELFILIEIFFGLNSPVWAKAIYIIMWCFFFSAVLELLFIRFFSVRRSELNHHTRTDFDLLLHQHDLNYRAIQIFIWAIPTLGFLGTVVGISSALEKAADMPTNFLDQVAIEVWFTNIVHALGYAFYTTIAGLVLSTVMTILSSFISSLEEQEINDQLSKWVIESETEE
ncbi:MAG: hypothetical protein HON68_08840 [Gammaproteobacteria bacterium]|jgi:hypothetical protein|nr:hypothetical protein [Gammaproteobacteria bacterium]MBT3490142.1 hypothetical protein [Gammaproteobacteria bacterium]MBT3717667.1 hypothetical protein [Gammaproteobacteria bacterium]MBT3845255.1 hypothetical protein [Gammaproteobacteria bacterium]MBT3892363.1 hypothetical protein [Gammaproteobacteria bacterium]